MPALFVSGDFLTGFEPPELEDDAKFFAVAYSENAVDDIEVDEIGWIEDRTRITDDIVVAALWAIMLTGVSDDGSNAQPLARVTAFAVDPIDADSDVEEPLPGERVVLYVTGDGHFVTTGTEDFAELHADVGAWDEVIKTFDGDLDEVAPDED